MSDIPEELKLTDYQIIDTLYKLVIITKELRECVNFIIEQTLKLRIKDLRANDIKRTINRVKHFDSRLGEIEDGFHGFLEYYHKQKPSEKKKEVYTIEGGEGVL